MALPLVAGVLGGAVIWAGTSAAASGPTTRIPIGQVETFVASKLSAARALQLITLLNAETAQNTKEAIAGLSAALLPRGSPQVDFVVVADDKAADMECTRACALPAHIYASMTFVRNGQYHQRPHVPLPSGLSHWAFIMLHEFGHIMQYRNLGDYPPAYVQAAEYTKEQEFEADSFAVAVARRAGLRMAMPVSSGRAAPRLHERRRV